MCLGKWNVLRPISLLDIKDVKPTPKEHDGGKEWKEVKEEKSSQKQTPLPALLPVADQTKVGAIHNGYRKNSNG